MKTLSSLVSSFNFVELFFSGLNSLNSWSSWWLNIGFRFQPFSAFTCEWQITSPDEESPSLGSLQIKLSQLNEKLKRTLNLQIESK
jgi:hypothetical protein